LICKGADSVIIERLAQKQDALLKTTGSFVDAYADEGLRTLYVARKEITDYEFDEWIKKKQKAQLAL
jgi:magnesium-transporting ATPase (P-type)